MMTLDEFRNALMDADGRQQLGIDMGEREARRVAEDGALARAYYDNWLRTQPRPAPAPPVPEPAAPSLASAPTAHKPTSLPPMPAPAKARRVSWSVVMYVAAIVLIVVVIAVDMANPNRSPNTSAQGITRQNTPVAQQGTPPATPAATPQPKAPVKPPKSPAQTRDSTAKARGFTVLESGNLYVKSRPLGTFTCDYGSCLEYELWSVSGCPGGAYVRADIMSNRTAIDWTNEVTPSIRAGETVRFTLTSLTPGADAFRLSEVSCRNW